LLLHQTFVVIVNRNWHYFLVWSCPITYWSRNALISFGFKIRSPANFELPLISILLKQFHVPAQYIYHICASIPAISKLVSGFFSAKWAF
jgi:hypothetical protein